MNDMYLTSCATISDGLELFEDWRVKCVIPICKRRQTRALSSHTPHTLAIRVNIIVVLLRHVHDRTRE